MFKAKEHNAGFGLLPAICCVCGRGIVARIDLGFSLIFQRNRFPGQRPTCSNNPFVQMQHVLLLGFDIDEQNESTSLALALSKRARSTADNLVRETSESLIFLTK